jgi:4-amino-4-deoxy-L-arabinose transferase-like glycosyltransferase
MLVLGAVLAIIVYRWSRELWGRGGALLSLFLACLSPTLLAHSRLVTTDLPAALGFTTVLWSFWRFCARPSWLRAAATALCMVLALLVKFSALLLPAMLAIIGVLWICWPGLARAERVQRLRWLAAAAMIVLVVAYAGLWAGYGFRFEAVEAGYELDWEVVGLKEGPAADLVQRALGARLLPEGYLYGMAYFLGGAERRVAFLNGEQSLIGWWYYFPQAFVMKTSPALLLLLGWVGVASTRCGRWRSFGGWFLVLPIAVYMAVSVMGNLNIGHRHLVPLYPLFFVLCGALPRIWRDRRPMIAVGTALLFLYLASFAIATPRYLSYFNVLAGGANGGWRYLLDSNIDWGQDLSRLARWMERNDVDEIDLVYFGTADPLAYHIPHRKILVVQDFHPRQPTVRPEPGRLVAVSVNLLQGLYFDRDQAFAEALQRRRLVTDGQIDAWLELRERLSKSRQRHPDFASWAVREGIISDTQRSRIEDQLLTGWFRRLREEHEPIAKAGDSIFIFRTPGP